MFSPVHMIHFRYTFGSETVTNVPVGPGLYVCRWRGAEVVVSVDPFGEMRVARETPVNNLPRFAMAASDDDNWLDSRDETWHCG